MVDFAKENRESNDNEKDDYSRVLREIGIDTEKNERPSLSEMPLYICIVDIDDIHSVSPLVRSPGFTQIDFKDESTYYGKIQFADLERILREVGIIHKA